MFKLANTAPCTYCVCVGMYTGSGVCLSLVVSGDGMRVLLLTVTGQVFLWECVDVRDLSGVRDGTARGRWAQIQHPGNTALPSPKDKEASQHSIFVRGEVRRTTLSTGIDMIRLEMFD